MTPERILRAFGVGAATGLRTMTGPATAFAVRKNGNWNWILLVGALSEYVVDKLPSTPPRTRPFGLIARAVAASFAAGSLDDTGGEEWFACAAVGIAGAMTAAYAGAAYRAEAARRNIPDIICALAEDATAITLARTALNRH